MDEFIPVNEPLLNGNEKKYLCECIDSGWISSEGPFVERFEEGMSRYVGRKYGVAVSSGTAALETAVQALDLPWGSEVILPAFTIISCVQAIVKSGLVPVVVDCEEDTWNMDTHQIEEKITDRTAAIMAVHIYGITVDMDPVLALAKKYDLRVIEDAAQAHGQTYKGKRCGSFGTISVFSFYPNKHITCGEGGMVLTDDEELAQRCRRIRNLCFQPERRFVHEELGENFRMTNLQAAVGVAQLERIGQSVIRKRQIGSFYREALANIKNVRQPLEKTGYCDNIYWVYGLVLMDTDLTAQRAMKLLRDAGIGTRPFFYPIHKQPVLLRMGLFSKESCPVSEYIAEKGFYIPSGLGLTEEKLRSVADKVCRIFGGGAKMTEIIRLFNELSDGLRRRSFPIRFVPVQDIRNILLSVSLDRGWVELKMQMLAHLIEREDYEGGALFFEELSCMTDIQLSHSCVEYASYIFRNKMLEKYRDSSGFKGKGVIYTVLTGNYEALHEPGVVDPRFDYICFTDDDALKSKTWSVRKLTDMGGLGAQRLSRRPKILANDYLKEYDFSVYIDCKYEIRGDLYQYINKYSMGAPMLCFPHGGRDCVYQEAEACIAMHKDNTDAIMEQIERYRKIGMPEHYGLIEAGCMVRRHGDPLVIKVMEDWWEEFLGGCRRDQISFPYVCWKNDFKYDVSDLFAGENEYIGLARGDV